ncbi:MAG: chemotaxis protein CheW, partial [Dehalococcoidia bacterium]
MQDKSNTEQQLVVFDLSGEDYGIDIGAVRSIIRMQEITKVPGTPDYVEGVTNLRGSIIPVVDLRKRFGLTASDQTNESRVVVVDISGQD